jgi:hypothetical protein
MHAHHDLSTTPVSCMRTVCVLACIWQGHQHPSQGHPPAACVTPSGPKLYLYAWCGVSQDQLDPNTKPDDNADFIATIDVSHNLVFRVWCKHEP